MKRKGIFETVRIEKGRAVLLSLHFDRLRKGASFLDIPLGLSLEDFAEIILSGCSNDSCLVRFTLFSDGSYTVSGRPCVKRDSVKLLPLYSVRRNFSPLSLVKKLDIMDSLYALGVAEKKGYDEAVLFDPCGFLSEAAFANIFFLKGGVLFTPSLKTGCLPGTRRTFLIDLCREMGISVIEGFFRLEELLQADEVFITSAREDAVPVVQIGSFRLSLPKGKPFYQRFKEVIYFRTFCST